MYKLPENYVVTYDSSFVQQHVDSSDFEDASLQPLETKKGKHKLLNQKKHKMRIRSCTQHHDNPPDLYIDCDEYPVKLKKESDTPQTSETLNKYVGKPEKKQKSKKKKPLTSNQGDVVLPVKSKLSIITHKLMPRLSSMFKWSNTKQNMSVIEENHGENTRNDNCYQHCTNCGASPMRKLYKTQNFVVQPVYAIEGNAHKTTTGPFIPTKITDEPLKQHNRKTKNQYSSYGSLSSSSESDTQSARYKQQKVQKFRKRLKAEIMKEHLKYQQNQPYRTQKHQYPSKENRYQVYAATPIQSQTETDGLNISSSVQNIPSSSSNFWNYLYDKTNSCGRKYQTNNVAMQCQQRQVYQQSSQGQPCQCSASKQKACGQSPCCTDRKIQIPECNCKQKMMPPVDRRCDPKCSAASVNKVPKSHSGDEGSSSDTSLKKKDKKKKKKEAPKEKVDCECPMNLINKMQDRGRSRSPSQGHPEGQRRERSASDLARKGDHEKTKPCQVPHDEITSSLSQKYKGEVICIHNPPCILINGCLNLPGQAGEDQQKNNNNDMNFWPVTAMANQNLFIKNDQFREQSCQYHLQIQNDKSTDYRAEKIIQSICHHSPPCEVVRGCCKGKFDPELQTSCVHVPMCKKMPECVIGNRHKKVCDHRPKCRDIPICSRDFVILTAKENIGTQVLSTIQLPSAKESFVCRHEPPCIMIPKCIGKVLCDSTYLNVDAIPGCIHHPSCELIPACCRKTMKAMVSVSSQYPNSCRIS